mgnify:CR=1 FL=1
MNATHVYFKIKIPGYRSKFSAWFKEDPICGLDSPLTVLVDCERIDALGRSFPCTEKVEKILITGGWSAGQICKFRTRECLV